MKFTTNHGVGAIALIRYRFGRTKGVHFKRKDIGQHGVRWTDLLAYNDGAKVM